MTTPDSELHAAVCRAVSLLNLSPEVAGCAKGREAHNILRQALVDYADAFDALAAQAAQPVAWQPIETAPRGSGENGPGDTRHPDYVRPPRLLLWTTEGIIVGYYDWYYHAGYGRGAESGVPAWRDVGGGPAYAPTHWMPLPPPPEADTQEKP